jgi:hypothetical protein
MLSEAKTSADGLSRRDLIFVAACIIAYSTAVLIIPPYTPLLEPDSNGYILFLPLRSAFYPAFLYICRAVGLDLVQTTWVQIAIFGIALGYLLTALLRINIPRLLIAIFVIALAANILFSSFHRSILTESLYFSFSVVAVALWIDYFRDGRVRFLALAGLVLGLLIGIRPAGLGLLPMHIFTVWLRRPKNISIWLLVLTMVLPVAIGAGSERLLYRAVHGAQSQTTAPNLAMGIGAMLIEGDMKFTGPHAATLNFLGERLYAKYESTHRYLAAAPSLAVRAQLSAAYEAESQFQAFDKETISQAERQAGAPIADLVVELGKQIVRQNLSGYLKLVLLNQFGQWSVAAQNFPPMARALAAYADANPATSFGGKLSHKFLHPRPSTLGLVVYPAFLIAGVVTLVLSVVFLLFLWRPSLMDEPEGFYLGVAAFLSAMCQGYTLFISLINEWTPRFLMAVMPQLQIIGLCIILLVMHRCKLLVLCRPGHVQ